MSSSKGNKSSTKGLQAKIAGASIAVIVGLGALVTVTSGASVKPDEEGIRYDHPPFSGQSFSGCDMTVNSFY